MHQRSLPLSAFLILWSSVLSPEAKQHCARQWSQPKTTRQSLERTRNIQYQYEGLSHWHRCLGHNPYVIGGLQKARENGILTGCITCNPKGPIVQVAEYPIVVVVGPEFVTGSTRLKAGTAQKMVLNMITTTLMIKLGRVKGNKMVNMQLTNKKLIERGTRMIVEELNIQREAARILLMEQGSVKKALEFYRENYK
jgi:hypothetical protein